jgi:hypothetical protein
LIFVNGLISRKDATNPTMNKGYSQILFVLSL